MLVIYGRDLWSCTNVIDDIYLQIRWVLNRGHIAPLFICKAHNQSYTPYVFTLKPNQKSGRAFTSLPLR